MLSMPHLQGGLLGIVSNSGKVSLPHHVHPAFDTFAEVVTWPPNSFPLLTVSNTLPCLSPLSCDHVTEFWWWLMERSDTRQAPPLKETPPYDPLLTPLFCLPYPDARRGIGWEVTVWRLQFPLKGTPARQCEAPPTVTQQQQHLPLTVTWVRNKVLQC